MTLWLMGNLGTRLAGARMRGPAWNAGYRREAMLINDDDRYPRKKRHGVQWVQCRK